MNYISTRGLAPVVSSGEAITRGLASDGGLYVPEEIPGVFSVEIFSGEGSSAASKSLTEAQSSGRSLSELCALPYQSLAYEILKLFLTDYPQEELRKSIDAAYSHPARFSHPQIAPLAILPTASCRASGVYFLELFHGRTSAFKDMALSLLPLLLTQKAKEKTVILTATSGDTGKAALEAFADVPNVEIIVFYPQDGVSDIQKLQMTTQEGGNVHVVGVRGNFDDAQKGVKKIFAENNLGVHLSSANSINVGRLLPQIVYYFFAYGQLLAQGAIKPGGLVDFAVPTGNFGNILAGYYAKRMGLPVRRLVCASNQNNVLHQFFHTGEYDANRKFHATMSPSMDILVSSNLERLLFHASGDPEKVRAMMNGLSRDGRYSFKIPEGDFKTAFATEEDTRAAMKEIFSQGYLADPHTAVAYHAAKMFKQPGIPMVITATASPFKFASDVCEAIGVQLEANTFAQTDALTQRDSLTQTDAFAQTRAFTRMNALSKAGGVPIPGALLGLKDKPVRHFNVCDKDKMTEEAAKILSRLS